MRTQRNVSKHSNFQQNIRKHLAQLFSIPLLIGIKPPFLLVSLIVYAYKPRWCILQLHNAHSHRVYVCELTHNRPQQQPSSLYYNGWLDPSIPLSTPNNTNKQTYLLKCTNIRLTPSPLTHIHIHTHKHTHTHTHTHTTLLYILGALCPSLSRDGTLDAEIHLRIQEASVAFGKLEKRVWSDRSISLKTKINVYKSYVLTTLLYSSETWTTYRWHPKWLEIVHQKCLRRILRISWQTCTPNTEVLHIADCLSIEAQMVCSQMRWSGHVVHMEDPQGALPYLT